MLVDYKCAIHTPHPSLYHSIKKYQPNPSFLHRHVKWLKENRDGVANIAVKALAILESIALIFTGIGAIFFFKGLNLSKKIKLESEFFYTNQNAQPPPFQIVENKTRTESLNHLTYFAIHDGVIWHKSIYEQNAKWQMMYFDGYASKNKKTPKEISADGANLIVLDNRNYIHYKKVIKDKRNVLTKEYTCGDKSQKNNWYNKWFSVPVIHNFVNLFHGKRLKLNDDVLSWCISHRGNYNKIYQDGLNLDCVEPGGVTNLFVLPKTGSHIRCYDAWVPKKSKIVLPLPQTSTSSFEGIKIDSASSTIVLLGYKTESTADGLNTLKTLQIQTQLSDIDTLGWNPIYKYSYNSQGRKPKARHLPMPGWQNHPLPSNCQITSGITILQRGLGNNARELRVVGRNESGIDGYFYKNITDAEWSFSAKTNIVNDNSLLAQSILINPPFNPKVSNYRSNNVKSNGANLIGVTAKLENFGTKGNFDSKLTIIHEGTEIELLLYRKRKFINFCIKRPPFYDLVIPNSNDLPQSMKTFIDVVFGNKRVFPVQVKLKEDNISIKGKTLTMKFQFVN